MKGHLIGALVMTFVIWLISLPGTRELLDYLACSGDLSNVCPAPEWLERGAEAIWWSPPVLYSQAHPFQFMVAMVWCWGIIFGLIDRRTQSTRS